MLLFNLIGFNAIWFSLIYFGDIFTPIAIAFLGLHIYLNRSTATSELLLIFMVATIGIFVDSTLQYFGVFIFTEQSHLPFWLMVLWLCFATTISHSLSILSSSKILQALVGIFIAPLSYLAGFKLNAVKFGIPVMDAYILLSIIWCLLMVSFFYLKDVLKETEISYE